MVMTIILSLILPVFSCVAHASSHTNNAESNDDTGLVDSDNTDQNVLFDSWYKKHGSRIPKHIPTDGKSVFIFNPHTLRWRVYDSEGYLVGSGHGSGGRKFCPDIQEPCRTPVGTFEVDGFGGPDCVSTLFPVGEGGAPMPYCMYVNGDFAIHGSYDVPNYNASHGCIRVKPSAAKWLQDNVIDYGSTVIVLPY